MDEAIFAFGSAIESELNDMKQGKTEKPEAFSRRKQVAFLQFLEAEDEIKFASPIATK